MKNKLLKKIYLFSCGALIILSHQNVFAQSSVQTSEQLNLELRSLEEFKDIAVIQRKYLQKTERFEAFASVLTSLNSQLFSIFGFNGTIGYHFSERFALEGSFIFSADSRKDFTRGLEEDYFIQTKDLVTPESYMGLQLRWSPVYGKISLRSRTINPFEVYFTAGGGITGTDDGQSAPTLHLGVGQFYPLSKNMTFRWGLGFNMFQATSKGADKEDITAYMLHLTGGVSWFFPFTEAR